MLLVEGSLVVVGLERELDTEGGGGGLVVGEGIVDILCACKYLRRSFFFFFFFNGNSIMTSRQIQSLLDETNSSNDYITTQFK